MKTKKHMNHPSFHNEPRSKKNKSHWFHISHALVVAFFLIVMIFVVFIAYSQKNGFTGSDVATLQKMRYDALKKGPP